MVLGGVILKLEEFERAASKKDGGSGKGGGGGWHCFFFFGIENQYEVALAPNILKSGGGGGGVGGEGGRGGRGGGGGVIVFFMEEIMQSVMFLV